MNILSATTSLRQLVYQMYSEWNDEELRLLYYPALIAKDGYCVTYDTVQGVTLVRRSSSI